VCGIPYIKAATPQLETEIMVTCSHTATSSAAPRRPPLKPPSAFAAAAGAAALRRRRRSHGPRSYLGAPVLQLYGALYGPASVSRPSPPLRQAPVPQVYVLVRMPVSHAHADRALRGGCSTSGASSGGGASGGGGGVLRCACDGGCGLIEDLQGARCYCTPKPYQLAFHKFK
jgi:MYXO-CTERM domain-containing protein